MIRSDFRERFIIYWRNPINIYLAGPMRGIPEFNFPAFFEAAARLSRQGHIVFNPAEKDVQEYGAEISKSATGSYKDIQHLNFSLRRALEADLGWICREADAIALLPGWEQSKGARAEKALADALGLDTIYMKEFT